MDFFDAVKQRHCYRGPFTSDPIPRSAMEQIVQAGLDAPSGVNQQSTRFVVVDAPEILAKIASFEGCKPCMQTAQAIILCVVDVDPKPAFMDMEFQVEDCAAAVENMLLAITALGYASVWIDGWLRRENRAQQIAEWIGLPADKVIRVMLPVGVPAEPVKGPNKKTFEERVCFNRYA